MNQYHVPRGARTQAEYFSYVAGLPWAISSGSLSVHPNEQLVELDGAIDVTGTDIVFIGVSTSPNPAVPTSVTPRQIRLALTRAGLRATVEAAVVTADQDTKDTWEFSTEILRSNPLLNSMAIALGMTTAQVDGLFILAATL